VVERDAVEVNAAVRVGGQEGKRGASGAVTVGAIAQATVVLVVRGGREGRLAVGVGRDASGDLLALELAAESAAGWAGTHCVSNHFIRRIISGVVWQLMNAMLRLAERCLWRSPLALAVALVLEEGDVLKGERDTERRGDLDEVRVLGELWLAEDTADLAHPVKV
jgi:hypothetical protein